MASGADKNTISLSIKQSSRTPLVPPELSSPRHRRHEICVGGHNQHLHSAGPLRRALDVRYKWASALRVVSPTVNISYLGAFVACVLPTTTTTYHPRVGAAG